MLIRSLVKAFARQLATIETRRFRPRKSSRCKAAVVAAVEILESRSLLSASVLSFHNGNQSSGVNSQETLLTTSSVNVNTFQKESQISVDGPVYAQPLYVPALNLTGGSAPGLHNVTVVATENDSVYAIDTLSGKVLWNISLTDSSKSVLNPLQAVFIIPIPASDAKDNQFGSQFGITATPVIDSSTNTLYVEAATKQFVSGSPSPHFVQMLYKINLAAGTVSSSTIIGDTISDGTSYSYRIFDTGTGTDPYVVGTGAGSISNRVYFNALREFDQSALALSNGHLIVSFSGHASSGGAVDPAHGWVMMFNAGNLGIQGAFNTTPNGGQGGIWQSGAAPVIDSQGNLYVQTSLGTFDSNNNVALTGNGFQGNADYSDSFLKISLDPNSTQSNQNGNPNGWGLKLTDYFSPFNNSTLNAPNMTLGSGGITLLPDSVGTVIHPHLMIGAGEAGTIYLIDRDNMGKFNPLADSVVQTVVAGINGSTGSPAFFNGQLYYFPGLGGAGRAYAFLNGAIGNFVQTPDVIGIGDGTPSISANGNSNGVVWVVDRGSNQLKAYSAADLTTQLWTSAQAPGNRDQLGQTVNFAVPTVADGQVIVGTGNQVVIYGPPVGTSALANIEATPLNYIENGITPITSTMKVTLTGGSYINQATVQITGNYQLGQDTLVFQNTSQLTGIWNSGTGTLTIKGLASAAVYQAALRSVAYRNLQDNPNVLNRTVTFQTGSTLLSNTQTRTITVTPVNDPPVITVESTTLDYIRLSTTPISPGLLVSDPDNATLPSATVQITGNYQPIEDRLIFQNTANIKGSWNANTGTLTLTGVDTGSNYRTALRSVSFYDIEAVPNTVTRTVSFSTTDGSLPSNIATRDINVIRQNNAPLLSAIETTPLAYTQDAPAVAITSTILVSDPDNATLPSATVQITGGYQKTADLLTFVDTATITGSWDANTGTLTLTGTDTGSNYRAALRSVLFSSSDVVAGPQTRTITFQTTDGTAVSNTVTRQINITAVPTLSGIETTPLTYSVPNAKVQVTSSIQIKVYDQGTPTGAAVHVLNVQSGDLLSATTIPGVLASWNAATGTLTITGSSSIANYNTMLRSVKYSNPSPNPSNVNRQISFQVFEGSLGSNLEKRNINFSGTNSPPVLSGIETTPTTYTANGPAVVISSTINVFDANDATLTGAIVQISFNYIYGQDVLKFVNTPTIKGVWTPATARMTLTGVDTVANYQAALRSITFINTAATPSKVTRTVSFSVTDGADPDNFDSNIVTRDINVTL